MTFSDWITIASILIAVIFAVFKFDELEIIRLKNASKYLWLPFLVFALSGVTAYFHSNPHPETLDIFWPAKDWWNFHSGLWPILWLGGFLLAAWLCWGWFRDQPPHWRLIEHYIDILNNDETRFVTSFKKYERYFNTNITDDAWLGYQELFKEPNWWRVAPTHFRQIIKDHPSRFFDMHREVLIKLLQMQFSSTETQMMRELEHWPNDLPNLDSSFPLLNVFLGTRQAIMTGRSRNILLPTVKDSATDYYNSLEFLEADRRILVLQPTDTLVVIPAKLRIFYYINFIHWYWISVIRTHAGVAGFYQYQFWTDLILQNAPIVNEEKLQRGGEQPNHYTLAVDRMLRNIDDWIKMIDDSEIRDMVWATDHFLKLKLWMLSTIRRKHFDKVIEAWYIGELSIFIGHLMHYRRMYGENFDPTRLLSDYKFPPREIGRALTDFTEEHFPGPWDQRGGLYQWIANLVSHW